MATVSVEAKVDSIPFQMHPRVFAALGSDLVTNDVVAIIELVKNSYDAFAHNVWVRFKDDPITGGFLEIEDDGLGMTREEIENIWCLVATPHKQNNSMVSTDGRQRRVSGAKGLGRLAAARLGNKLQVLTQASNTPCWKIEVDWNKIFNANSISEASVECQQNDEEKLFNASGTCIKITELNTNWDGEKIDELEKNLARLLPPFEEKSDFNIFIQNINDSKDAAVKIETLEFLKEPKYCLRGMLDKKGNFNSTYQYASIDKSVTRTKQIKRNWKQLLKSPENREDKLSETTHPQCGPFEFEIRAWDISPEDTEEIEDNYNIKKNLVRKAIAYHKGISIYRDKVLVLPKSESSRDWLKLDPRRIGRVGPRLSNSQIVGYVSISSDQNPNIEDTSSRENLVSNEAVAEFKEILVGIVGLLEIERGEDRYEDDTEKTFDLFEKISTNNLISEVENIKNQNGSIDEIIPILVDLEDTLNKTQNEIKKRFILYGRMATVGTIALVLVHEIRNRTSSINNCLKFVQSEFSSDQTEFKAKLRRAFKSVEMLEQLADKFAPLARVNLKKRNRTSILEEQISESIQLCFRNIDNSSIEFDIPETYTKVAVDPGHLDTILINLILNSKYWILNTPSEEKKLVFNLKLMNKKNRVQVILSDTGTGIEGDNIERIFEPGVTQKPDGIGIGLTVVAELLALYDGKIAALRSGLLGGATFIFDIPLIK